MPQIVIRMNSVFAIISSFIPHAAISAATGGSTKKTLLDVNECNRDLSPINRKLT